MTLAQQAVAVLRDAGVMLDPGLGEGDIDDVEARYDIRFGDDHRTARARRPDRAELGGLAAATTMPTSVAASRGPTTAPCGTSSTPSKIGRDPGVRDRKATTRSRPSPADTWPGGTR